MPAPAVELIRRTDLIAHPRVARAVRYRSDTDVNSDPQDRGVLILGRGLAGRLEVSVDVDPKQRARGLRRALARSARSLVPREQPLFAQVTPGNVASVRAFLGAGYRPICSEVLFLKQDRSFLLRSDRGLNMAQRCDDSLRG